MIVEALRYANFGVFNRFFSSVDFDGAVSVYFSYKHLKICDYRKHVANLVIYERQKLICLDIYMMVFTLAN